MERDLQRLGDVKEPGDFLNVLDGILTTTLTNDFWRTTLPSQLETSSANAPGVLLFYAAQGILSAPALFSQRRVADLIDDAMRPTRKPLERHHLFPRKVLEAQNLDTRAINQAANMALLEWPDNAAIGKQAPPEYVPVLRARFAEEVWSHMCRLHALPPEWEKLEYAEFLRQRRQLMASVIRLAFDVLSDAHIAADTAMSGDERRAWTMIEDVELTLRRLVRARYQNKWPDRGDGQIRKLVGEDAWATIVSNREKHAVQYRLHGAGATDDILDYTYLSQLSQLMLAGEAWDMFKPMFRDRRQLEDLIRSITPVRNDRAHFRQVPETELRRCELACLDLKALLGAG